MRFCCDFCSKCTVLHLTTVTRTFPIEKKRARALFLGQYVGGGDSNEIFKFYAHACTVKARTSVNEFFLLCAFEAMLGVLSQRNYDNVITFFCCCCCVQCMAVVKNVWRGKKLSRVGGASFRDWHGCLVFFALIIGNRLQCVGARHVCSLRVCIVEKKIDCQETQPMFMVVSLRRAQIFMHPNGFVWKNFEYYEEYRTQLRAKFYAKLQKLKFWYRMIRWNNVVAQNMQNVSLNITQTRAGVRTPAECTNNANIFRIRFLQKNTGREKNHKFYYASFAFFCTRKHALVVVAIEVGQSSEHRPNMHQTRQAGKLAQHNCLINNSTALLLHMHAAKHAKHLFFHPSPFIPAAAL